MVMASCVSFAWQIVFSQGLMFGIRGIILNFVHVSVFSEWFGKKQGQAMGIIWLGYSVGAGSCLPIDLPMAPRITWLREDLTCACNMLGAYALGWLIGAGFLRLSPAVQVDSYALGKYQVHLSHPFLISHYLSSDAPI